MKRKTKLTILALLIMLMVIIGTSYSFFAANISYVNKTNTKLVSNTLGLNFKGKTEVLNCSNIVPGDKCIKTFDVENTSNTATYYNIYMEDITNGFNGDLVYTLKEGNTVVLTERKAPSTKAGKTYIKANIQIPASPGKHEYTLILELKYFENKDQNVNQGKQFSTTIGIDTTQQLTYNGKKCIRATGSRLHQETCNNEDTVNNCRAFGYNYGDNVTFGNETVTTGTLAAGDAFDCDVNGNDIVENDERFYYVSTMDNGQTQNTDVAVLIYNRDWRWSGHSSWYANMGPDEAIKNLPTIDEWPGMRLTNTTRAITYETNTVSNASFEYKYNGVDLASRLITYQEVLDGCYDGETSAWSEGGLKNCRFLFANTYFSNPVSHTSGTWLETPYSEHWHIALFIASEKMSVGCRYVDGAFDLGARPTIEVAKTDMAY